MLEEEEHLHQRLLEAEEVEEGHGFRVAVNYMNVVYL